MPYPRILSILAVASLLPMVALGQAPAPAEVPTLAENAIIDAIIKLRLRERIAADVVQEVSMLDQTFSLEGNYFKDTGHRVRLRLDLKGLGDTGSTMLQVCDGKILWDYQKVLNNQTYRRREITPILKRLEDPNLDDQFRGMILTQIGFGGPEALLTGLQKAIKFDQFAEENDEGVAAFVLGGTWRDRSVLMGPGERSLSPTDRLPPYIPSNVRVFIDKATSWPYKVVMIGNAPLMLREDNRAIGPDGRPIGVKKAAPKVEPSRITLKYKLKPDSEIKAEYFFFQTPADASTANLKDDTQEFLDLLEQYIQVQINQKKAEAAKAEGEPLLKAPPIEIPSPRDNAPTPGPATPK